MRLLPLLPGLASSCNSVESDESGKTLIDLSQVGPLLGSEQIIITSSRNDHGLLVILCLLRDSSCPEGVLL